ncbi:MAG: hypothetical protein WAO02_17655 [Verrucomicrobiia bacterium]
MPTKSTRRLALELVAASFVVLFQELTLIRWLGGQVRVLAYFPNLILLSAFLGLGLGCLRGGKRSLLWLWPVSLVLLAGVAAALGRIIFTQESASEHLWLLYYDLPSNSPVVNGVRLPIVLSFILSALNFVPLGQIVAERLQAFRARSMALQGYCWDILGSLIGVIGFALASFAHTFPIVWFCLFLGTGFLFFAGNKRLSLAYLVAAMVTAFIVVRAERAQYYSPYYALAIHQHDEVLANGSLHQRMVALQRGAPPTSDQHQLILEGYHVPYRMMVQPPRRVLVLGAGTGNDVSVALDEGAAQVDAVEIDPVILQLGKQFHPDHPYDSPKVRIFNTDARSFLNHSTDSYDLIVFGTLDSMTRLSALSNVRLDNFVYTLDCFKAARSHLTPDGGMALYFMVSTDYIHNRLIGMMSATFGELPVVHEKFHALFNTIFMGGPAFAQQSLQERTRAKAAFFREYLPRLALPDDDWPYLYLKVRGVSSFYLGIMGLIAALAILGVAIASTEMRRSLLTGAGMDKEMFLFGLAFLLLETRSVTVMNLAWGATWLTSAVVFGSILATILSATILYQWRPIPWRVGIGGLILSLLICYAFPTGLLLHVNIAARLGSSLCFVGTPVFFASLCFAALFGKRAEAGVAFGWNLLGAVAGGLLDFLSMFTGLKDLLLVALVAYLMAAIIHLQSTPGREPAPEQPLR